MLIEGVIERGCDTGCDDVPSLAMALSITKFRFNSLSLFSSKMFNTYYSSSYGSSYGSYVSVYQCLCVSVGLGSDARV